MKDKHVRLCLPAGKRGRICPPTDPCSTGSFELPSPSTCSSWSCWSWSAWCRRLMRTITVHCPTTLPDPFTPCCTTPTALHPHRRSQPTMLAQRSTRIPDWLMVQLLFRTRAECTLFQMFLLDKKSIY